MERNQAANPLLQGQAETNEAEGTSLLKETEGFVLSPGPIHVDLASQPAPGQWGQTRHVIVA